MGAGAAALQERCRSIAVARSTRGAAVACSSSGLRNLRGPRAGNIIIDRLEWTCPLNGQIESGIDRCVGRVVYPDYVTGSS